MRNSVFLDTGHAIALANERDKHHDRAVELSERISQERRPLITTQPVLVEIGNRLAAPSDRKTTARYIEALDEEDHAEVVPSSPQLFHRGLALYKDRDDKDWGLTDCMSFVVMRDREIIDALTLDHHFEQAGFNTVSESRRRHLKEEQRSPITELDFP